MSIVAEARAMHRLMLGNAAERVASRVVPYSNRAVAAASGRDPLVWVGGLSSRASSYVDYQRAWQRLGVPTYLVDIGRGFSPVRSNADEVARTVERALAETGASRAWLGGQSKGTIDVRWALQHDSALAEAANGAFLVVGPHGGGLTTNAGAAQALRGASQALPRPVREAMRASTELLADSRELRTLADDLPRFLDEAPDHLRIDNFVTSVLPRPLPGHDGLVPLASQRLPRHARITEHKLTAGPFNHLTAHRNPQVVEGMRNVMGVGG